MKLYERLGYLLTHFDDLTESEKREVVMALACPTDPSCSFKDGEEVIEGVCALCKATVLYEDV